MPTWLDSIIVQTAKAGLAIQAANGSMPSGANGPHGHCMTPARNTSHWAVTFSKAHALSGDSSLRDAATRALDYVVSPSCRPMRGAFWHRQQAGRNSFNGLIGQAWTLESLCYGWQYLDDSRYRDVALEVYRQHRFDERMGLWWQLKLDGSPGIVEPTLNQQIWLGVVASLLSQGEQHDIEHQLDVFLDRLQSHMSPRWWGLLRLRVQAPGIVPTIRREVAAAVRHQPRGRALRPIEAAYHVFALCGLAHLIQARPSHPLWGSPRIRQLLRTISNRRFVAAVSASPYGYGYNVVGFEIPFILAVCHAEDLCDASATALARLWIDHQMRHHYDWQTHMLERNSVDPTTLAARFYEIIRIPESVWRAYEGDVLVDGVPQCWQESSATGSLS